MTNTIDGFTFDLPLNAEKIIELAHYHRQQLDEAVFHNEIHLGEYCLAQRKRVYDFTRTLEPQQRVEFYKMYDGELRRIADASVQREEELVIDLELLALLKSRINRIKNIESIIK